MAVIDKYWKFNVERFVKDYTENKQILLEKEEALSEIIELKTPNYDSPPGTPGRGDCVAASAEISEKLRNEIRDYRNIVRLYEGAEKTFSPDEKFVIEHLFHRPNSTMSTVSWLAKKIPCDRSTVYRIRREALEKVKKHLGV